MIDARSEEQELVAAAIARFVERDYGFEDRRRIVASADGYSEQVWHTMAELGLLGLALPSAHGGLDGGARGAMSLMHAIGSALVVEPWLACVGIAAQLVARGGSEAQCARILPAVAAGTLKLAFAHDEGEREPLAVPEATARCIASGYALSGRKRLVPHGCACDVLVVSARVDDDNAPCTGLLLVDRHAPGVRVFPVRMLDGTRATDVHFDAVHVPAADRLGADAMPLVEDVLDFATALLCAEAVGALEFARDATLEYLKTRRQFGVPIGSFQALQHRMVDVHVEVEQARSMALLACSAVDQVVDRVERARTVSAAKVRIAEACRRVSQESVQLHGGMGLADEMKVSHTFRRLTAIAQQFGDADYHLARFAALSDLPGEAT